MATKMRRLTIYLPQELDDALLNLSYATFQSRAQLARMFLQEAVPSINELAELLKAKREGDRDVILKFHKFMVRIRKELKMPLDLEVLDGGGGD